MSSTRPAFDFIFVTFYPIFTLYQQDFTFLDLWISSR
jgi:hypothetical protein